MAVARYDFAPRCVERRQIRGKLGEDMACMAVPGKDNPCEGQGHDGFGKAGWGQPVKDVEPDTRIRPQTCELTRAAA
jgi:hypothetical protein